MVMVQHSNTAQSRIKKIPSRNIILNRLDRNKTAISHCYAKLTSYVSEPQTYEQFNEFSSLKEIAHDLRDTNEKIIGIFKNDLNATLKGLWLIENHVQKFEVFTENVVNYTENVRVYRNEMV